MTPADHPGSNHNRLVYVVGNLDDGGIERQLNHILSHVDIDRYKPLVVSFTHKEDSPWMPVWRELGVDVIPIPAGLNSWGKVRMLRRLLTTARPEIVHSMAFYTNFPTWLAARSIPALVTGSIRSDWNAMIRANGRLLSGLCVRYPGTILANSADTAARLQQIHGPFAPKQVEFVPNAVDVDRSRPAPAWPQDDAFTIIGIGRLNPEKDWDLAFRSLSHFAKQYKNPWRFLLCGRGVEEARLRTLAQDLAIQDNVEFLGFQDDIPAVLARSHVFLLTSHYEGTPNALLEAMIAARPSVCARVGDIARLVEDGKSGSLIGTRNPAHYASVLLQLARNMDDARAMGQNAYRRILQEPSPSELVENQFRVWRAMGFRG